VKATSALVAQALWFAAMLVSGCSPATAQSTNHFDDYVHAYVRNGDFSGSVLITHGGRVVFRKSYGMANYELSVPNTDKSRFHIASVSKTFTAAAVVLLEKNGKLKLSDPLSKYLPGFLNGEKITLEQMLTHSSGLPDYYALPEYAVKKNQRVTLPDLIAWIKTKPLDFLPGTESRYSNTGYAFLAYIIEQASGESYDQFIADELFKPAGMKNSGTFRDDALIPERASGYQPWTGNPGMRNAPAYDKTILIGAGSLYSTTDDLFAWTRALREGKFFELSKLSYPYGWGRREATVHGAKRAFLEQDGRDPGFVSHVSMYLDDDLTVILLGNLEDGAVNTMADDLARIALGDTVAPPPPRGKHGSAEEGSDFAGTYQVRPDFLLDVKAEGSNLFLRGTGGDYLPLEPTGKDSFFYRQFYVPVKFKRDKAGKIEALLWKGDYPCKRISDKPQP
jgi:CubicO group peptidase (beta-lactamase class C family)